MTSSFDLVVYNVLIYELRYLGVHDVAVRLVASFFPDRSKGVSLCNTLSPAVTARCGILHGIELAPVLFAVLVNNLTWKKNLRAIYVDHLKVVEVILRASMSMLPIVANKIGTFAAQHCMR